jgi:transcriptional regulator
MASDLFTGSLELLILKALSWGPSHGYAVGRWIRTTTEGEVLIQEGALYPALHRLERRGLVSEEWGISDTRRDVKLYRLTPEGRRRLKAETARWNRYAEVMRLALAAARP